MSQRCYTCGRESPSSGPLLHFVGCEVKTPRPQPMRVDPTSYAASKTMWTKPTSEGGRDE